eukprot:TRINITY_DN32777_c0_g1_i2.p1 TRINITY_DN32777_c0_g1~~TRINITY_DN32777_c0_g1_i2.p1  ORF type:complete len:189 (-),score=37.17 TRINITY_DN32777_c0_g1_i2:34-600(-)
MLPVKLAGAALGAHVCITQSAVAYATLKRPQAAKLQDGASPELRRHVLEVVSQMYSGRGLTARLSSDVAFEEQGFKGMKNLDPLALCQGDAEVREAFRALKACKPEQLQVPNLAGITEDGSLLVELQQRYFNCLCVKSTLVVSVAASGEIRRFEERWNGVPLLDTAPFPWSRRLNGILSYALSSRLVG